MKFTVRFKATPRSRSLIEFTAGRVHLGLAPWRRVVRSIVCCFEDVNGPKAGLDKQCTVFMTGGFGLHVVQTRDTEFVAAADQAIELCQRHVARQDRRRRLPSRLLLGGAT